jgi:hypothetical protein
LDIYGDRSDIVLRGAWHLLENAGGVPFRWAGNNALVIASTFVPCRQRLSLDVEPGPGVVASPFRFLVFDAFGNARLDATFAARTTVELGMSATGPAVQSFRLYAPGGGRTAGRDQRVLDFRVFRIGLATEPSDVVPAASGCRVGAGWHALESHAGATFRWVENDARIVVDDPRSEAIELELEPGPGIGRSSFDLQVRFDDGAIVHSYVIANRTRIAVPLPRGTDRPREILLHADGGGLRTPGDDRVLNFRAFSNAT